MIFHDQLGIAASWEQIEKCAAEECGRIEAALRSKAVENEPNPAKIN